MSTKEFDDLPDAEQFTPGALEYVCRRVCRAPFRDDTVKGYIGFGEPGRNEVRRRPIPSRPLPMGRVEQPVLPKIRVELKPDEPALQAAVEAELESGCNVGIQ